MSVIIETTLGDITVDLYTKERKRSCLNFLKLCKVKYYNFCLFFSVQRNFIAQTGDPSGTGKGGESIFMKAYGEQAMFFEMELKPKIKHRKKGLISFANNGSNMHGSQFFITLAENLDYLDGKHTVFGEVAEGFDVLNKINETICDKEDRPYQDIRINHTIILDDPFDDIAGIEIPDRSPEPTREQLESGRIGADEEIDETKGKSLKQIEEAIEEKDLNIGTQILETIGDIPDADLKPPENVMFICKLNPVTTAEDLEIIFSRFGTILSCEIIRDHKTGDSLCYGFIEFEKVTECEKAYFKMDNVLIDDRRIHVNFCQSVAKNKWSKSGLQSKYAFGGKEKTNPSERTEITTKKLSLKERTRNNKYEMVFDEDEDEYKRHKQKKEKKRHKKGNEKYDESEDDEVVRKKGRSDKSQSSSRYSEKDKDRKSSSKRKKKTKKYSSSSEECSNEERTYRKKYKYKEKRV